MSTTKQPADPKPPSRPNQISSPKRPSSRAIGLSRRRQSFVTFVRRFAAEPTGLVGLAILVLVVLAALFAPVITDANGLRVTQAPASPLEAPSSALILGADNTGRSVALLTLWGARISLLVGLLASMLSMVLGTAMGIAAGHFRGWFGQLLQRVIDWFLVLPSLPLALALAAVLG